MKNNRFDRVLDMCFSKFPVGHFSKEKYSICLYGMENNSFLEEIIRKEISKITPDFKIIILSPNDKYTNVNILDIDL
jgi:hypothetical protein